MNNSLAYENKQTVSNELKTWHLFFLLTLANVLIAVIFNQYIMTKEIYYSLYSDQMELVRIDQHFEIIKKYSVIGYLVTPIILWLSITFVSLMIQLPLAIGMTEIKFAIIFRIVTLASFINVLSGLIKSIYLIYLPPENITQDIISEMPLALTNLLNSTEYSPILWTLFASINIFEIIWILVLYSGISKLGKLNKQDSFLLVFGTWIFFRVLQLGLMYFQELII